MYSDLPLDFWIALDQVLAGLAPGLDFTCFEVVRQ